jgi:hypothetical protein
MSSTHAVPPAVKSTPPNLKALPHAINHVFLPPKLPQSDDFDSTFDDALLDMVLTSLQDFKHLVKEDSIDAVTDLIRNIRAVRGDSGAINEESLKVALQGLREKGKVLKLVLRAQP